jgi:hypothetical protein
VPDGATLGVGQGHTVAKPIPIRACATHERTHAISHVWQWFHRVWRGESLHVSIFR